MLNYVLIFYVVYRCLRVYNIGLILLIHSFHSSAVDETCSLKCKREREVFWNDFFVEVRGRESFLNSQLK